MGHMSNFTLKLYKAFGLRKASMYPFDMNEEQFNTLQTHFKDILVHERNAWYHYDDDGQILDPFSDKHLQAPEDARYKYNIREAWNDFLGTMGPWYARGLYGRVHALPHDKSSDIPEPHPDAAGIRYESKPERYLLQRDYSAPNQWHSRLDFEQGVPGQEHPNNMGHVLNDGIVRRDGGHNIFHDNHWFGSHRYWGPYDLKWFNEGHHDGKGRGGKITVNNAEEGYHPDIYERFGGERAKALPFLDRNVLRRHNTEDSARNISGPNPLKWPHDTFDEWAKQSLSLQNHHYPGTYGFKYWDAADFGHTQDIPDYEIRRPSGFDPNEWENRMKD